MGYTVVVVEAWTRISNPHADHVIDMAGAAGHPMAATSFAEAPTADIMAEPRPPTGQNY